LEENREGISRRRLLKGLGAGTAVAWSAPVLMSINTPAFAQASPTCEPFDICGQGDFCGPNSGCGEGCGGCTILMDNTCFCWSSAYWCEPDGQTCQSDADCIPPHRCGRFQNIDCICGTGDTSACFFACGARGPARAPRGAKVITA
jgi:hypothetical protein